MTRIQKVLFHHICGEWSLAPFLSDLVAVLSLSLCKVEVVKDNFDCSGGQEQSVSDITCKS